MSDSQTAVEQLTAADPALAQLIEKVGPYRPARSSMSSTFEALSRSIAYQQLSGSAAGTIYGRFVTAYGDGQCPDPKQVAVADIEALRSVGLSRPKARYIQGLALAHRDGQLPTVEVLQSLDDEQIIVQLTAMKGVGRWTVQMLLMSWLERPDVLAADDLGIRKGFQLLVGEEQLPAPERILKYGERWRPWRSVASWYLWRALDL